MASNNTAGRTPQTKRKELALQNSPVGSPKSNNSSSIKKSSTNSRKNSLNGRVTNVIPVKPNSTRRQSGPHRVTAVNSNQVQTPPPQSHQNSVKLREETKFDGLWDVKTIENGLVRIPTQCLEELISKENIEKFYEVEDKPVASGLFATVRKCVHRETGITYAAKFCSRVRCGVDCSMEILHEIAMLSVCTDSNKIVHLKDVFQNKHEIILVLEYAPGGDFQSVLDEDMVPFEEDVQGFLRQILEALDFIHERNIAHLDIKPQNIVLMGQFPNCEIKLCDLEVARVIKEDEEIREIIGTPDYVAPEILSMESITLSADIWSLGVVAYVLLTGFSPFGGDTDQETLRNITTATLDFPPELFEGVSDLAKEFISLCLVRDATQRPTVKECLSHTWLSLEPPSPSPLMLKIPTPDQMEPVHPKHGHGTGGSGSPGGGGRSSSRRSCQTCRDKITERKRYLSKSREAIFEKVAQSNLKKSLSKSRERLCDMRLTLSKSRDNLLGASGDVTKVMSRQQDKLYGFKNLSKSQEVISAALGGVPMKRMINGAVSDISHALKQPPHTGSELPSPSMDFIFVPGSGILVPQSELLRINSGSLQVLPITESGRSTPASQTSVATVQDIPVSQAEVIVSSANVVVVSTPHTGSANLVETPLIEVSEEEDNVSNKSDKSSSTTTLSERASSVPKDIKESQNYEMKKQTLELAAAANNRKSSSMVNKKNSNPLEQELQNLQHHKTTNSVGIQVNLIQAAALQQQQPMTTSSMSSVSPSPSLARKLARLAQEPEEMNLERHLLRNNKSNYESKTLPRRKSNNDVCKLMKQSSVEEKPAPLRRGYTHDHMLGQKTCNPAWMDELNKIRSLKPIRITELIGTFDGKLKSTAMEQAEADNLKALKQKRRGSLQIQLDPSDIGKLAKAAEENKLKSQRRKSTPLLRNLEDQIDNILNLEQEKKDHEKDKSLSDDQQKKLADNDNESTGCTKASLLASQQQARKSELIQKNKQKNWDYFEIDHPKAISDKKLQQLKSKYLRRRTEGNLVIKEENEDNPTDSNEKQVPMLKADRSKSVPVCLGNHIVDHMEVEDISDNSKLRKVSTDSGEESADSSRRSSRSSVYNRRRLSKILGDQAVSLSEDDTIEIRIDNADNNPEDENKRRRLSVEIGNRDDGFISLPHTPTDLGMILDPKLKIAGTSSLSSTASTASTSQLADDGIFTSSEETLMKKAASLELACCDNNDDSSSRPSSATFSKKADSAEVATPSSTPTMAMARSNSRRQSSPMIRPSSS